MNLTVPHYLFCSITVTENMPSTKAILTVLAALPVAALSFSQPASQYTASSLRRSTSPLFVAAPFLKANGDNGSSDDAVLKQFEKKQAKFEKLKEEAQQKLNKLEENIVTLKSKKMEYLNGVSLGKSPPGGNFSETTARSAVKALMWRVIAGSVTFFTSLRFSGSVTTALTIVGSDFFSKAFTMFIGERIMNKSQAGRGSGGDNMGRSLAKALVWRLFAICNTLTMAIFVAKDWSIASKIAGSDAIFKTGLMFFYERVWARIQWGKEYQVEYNL
jgi:uncharacterized membrane protein